MYPAMTFTFSLESSSRGYHKYQSIWPNPTVDDELICEREVGNPHDTHAVAIKKDISGVLTTVEHVPRKISKVSSIFIRRGGTIQGRVNRHQCYSVDLVQGGLEIPCILTYTIDNEKEWVKMKRIININLGLITADSMDSLVNLEFLASVELASGLTPPVAVESPGSVMDLTAHCSADDQSPPKKKPKTFLKKT